MAEIIHLRCRHCGDLLHKSKEAYCAPCNLYLCYRAMPLLFGLIMSGHLNPDMSLVPGSDKLFPHEWQPFKTYMYGHTRHILD